MPTDPNMTGLIYPTESGDLDIWGFIMNSTCWPAIGEHDHTTGKGVKIPSAALKINADVSWAFGGTSRAITDAKALDFAAQAASAVSAYTGALFVNSDDANNLYFRTVGGTNVKITDGTTLNVSIVGGIGGDYSSVGALFDYDDATDTYRARQESAASVRQYAKLSIADLIIREYDPAGDATVPVETVTVKSPDALAASYSITLLAALPAAASLLRVSSAGVLSISDTIDESPTFATDRNITLAGSDPGTNGYVKHGVYRRSHQVTADYVPSGSVSTGIGATTGQFSQAIAAASTTFYSKLPQLDKNKRLVSLVLKTPQLEAGVSANVTYDVMRTRSTQTGFTSLLSGTVTAAPGSDVTLTLASSGHAMVDDEQLWIKIVVPAGEDVSYSTCYQRYDHP